MTKYILAYIAVAGAVRIGFWTAGIDFGERGVEAGFAYFMSLICGALGIAAVQVAEEA